eukprot:scaffold34459_cov45-Prasinocladus_malaysianus.AAC.1
MEAWFSGRVLISSTTWFQELDSGWFLILQARLAYCRVLKDSSKSLSDGLMQLMRVVRELPPSESCSSR